MSSPAPQALTRRSIFAQSWPIMLGQATIPLVGLVDTAVIGRLGNASALAGVGLGAAIIGLVFWSFGFLRMGVTGLTSQADGAGDKNGVTALLLRALAVAAALGLAIIALQAPISWLAFELLAGGEAVTREASDYVSARLYGAPAALCVFAINGWLLGLGRTRSALALQIIMNLANIGFDLLFVWGFGMGAMGVGLGTAIAEWISLVVGLVIIARIYGHGLIAMARGVGWTTLSDRVALKRLFAVNRDIMIRTFALLIVFTWFANAGARLGAVALAANQILLQFVNLAAFVLDSFAFTAEARVGRAIGSGSRKDFLRSIRLTGEFSLLAGIALSALFYVGGDMVISFMTGDPQLHAEAARFLPFAALIPLLGMPSWMLDGVFIGATSGKALRNAGVISAILYLALDYSLRPFGNWGVWMAISASYIFRAACLAAYFPSLLKTVGGGTSHKA